MGAYQMAVFKIFYLFLFLSIERETDRQTDRDRQRHQFVVPLTDELIG